MIQFFCADGIYRKEENVPFVTFLEASDEWFYFHLVNVINTNKEKEKRKGKEKEKEKEKGKDSPLSFSSLSSSFPKGKQIHSEFIPLFNYLFRYDKGAFWMLNWELDYFFGKWSHNLFVRWVLEGLCSAERLYWILRKMPKHVVRQVFLFFVFVFLVILLESSVFFNLSLSIFFF